MGFRKSSLKFPSAFFVIRRTLFRFYRVLWSSTKVNKEIKTKRVPMRVGQDIQWLLNEFYRAKKKIACDSPSLCQTWNVSNGFLTGFHWTVKKLFHKFGDRFQSSLRWDWERPAKNLSAPNFSLNSLISRWERRKKWKILFNLYYVFFSLICYEVMSYGNGCFILLSVWSSFNIIGPYSTALD